MSMTRRAFLKLGGAAVASLSLPRYVPADAARIPVLLYHDIAHQSPEGYAVPPALFAAQMEWLYSNGYRALSFRELDALDSESARQAVVITFDDGYASFMDLAFPLLKEYGFNSTVNIIGKHVGGFVSGSDPRLSWDECRLLSRSGLVELGCHSYGLHIWPGNMPRTRAIAAFNQKLAEDLSRFQDVYRKEMGRPASVLAWPYGIHDSRSIEIAKQAGFRHVLSSENRSFVQGGDPYDIPRLVIESDTNLRLFRERIERGP